MPKAANSNKKMTEDSTMANKPIGKELALKLEEQGYDWIKEELAETV